jgi:hypothetical protein
MGNAELFIFCLFTFFLVFLAASIRVVPEKKRLAVYRLGRYIGDKGPGLIMIIPIVDRGVLKDVVFDSQYRMGIPGQFESELMLERRDGKTLSRVFRDGGQVLLETGEKVDAISQAPIAEGRPVRVRRVIVEVEAIE